MDFRFSNRPFGSSAFRLSTTPVSKSLTGGLKIREVKTLEIEATYFVAFSCDGELGDDEKKHLLEQMAVSSAWQRFRDLFIHIGSQSAEELPLLPNRPKMRWLEPQEEGAEAQSASA
jgi:hypothetical protein